MKSLSVFIRLSLIILGVAGISSCEEKNSGPAGSGTMEFSVTMPDLDSKSVSDSTVVSWHVLISVTDEDSNIVFTDKLIPLYLFGNGFISENVEIEAGEYLLTKFMVINAAGEVTFAAPLEGSELAYLVKKPIPVHFRILPGTVTRLVPEVLAVEGHTPQQFGYVNFGISVVKPLDFWVMAVLDPGDLMPPVTITTARLTVVAPDGWHYGFRLEACPNHLIIRGGYDYYKFILEKEGYMPQTMKFSARQLIATSKDQPLVLKIPYGSALMRMVFQPGPEEGKDAMISNLEPDKNFGDHKYFEATFLSEPVLTVMRSNRSLIDFNLNALPKSATIRRVMLRLTYDLPIPFDSSYVTDTQPSTGIVWYGGVLQQIVEPWDEYKVTWNTQPRIIEYNQVYIPPFIRNVNFIEVDVTRLYVYPANTDMVNYPNYGMLFRLWPVDRFPGFRFASSDYPLASANVKMWPALTIFYTLP
ncbi:MAG TPA: DNRLRE domain-containing protein [Bacteroidales bacterium]|nr:DNRLRE domain-containing protein [Bacteroidales bacterium]HPF01772.1 DNRLRE domain-containing protein [Bacteroidales bacterium]HPI68790.1 DNRLRE domain-containing protein [Bacteroidales bacterium]HPR13654.1 DNRLRE domain-containing protein [Bacteroidales bacterium]HRW86557.1 DNRLRE domain-containing protein [Bacteroidales bacterium]